MAHKRVNFPSTKLKGIYPESTVGTSGPNRADVQSSKELGLTTSDNYKFSLGNWTERSADNRTFIANINLADQNNIFGSGMVSEDARGRPIRFRHNILDMLRGHGTTPGTKAFFSMIVEISDEGVITKVLQNDGGNKWYRPFFNPRVNTSKTDDNLTNYGTIFDNPRKNLSPKYFYEPIDIIYGDGDGSGGNNGWRFDAKWGDYANAGRKREEDILEWLYGGTVPYTQSNPDNIYQQTGRRFYTVDKDRVLHNGVDLQNGFYSMAIEFGEEPNAWVRPMREDYTGIYSPALNIQDIDSLVVEFADGDERICRNIYVRPMWENVPDDQGNDRDIFDYCRFVPNGSDTPYSMATQLDDFDKNKTYEIIFPRTYFIKNPADQLHTLESFAETMNVAGDPLPYPTLPSDNTGEGTSEYGGFFDTGLFVSYPMFDVNAGMTTEGEFNWPKLPLEHGYYKTPGVSYNFNTITDAGELKPAESIGGGPVIEFNSWIGGAGEFNLSDSSYSPKHGVNPVAYLYYLGFPTFRWSTLVEASQFEEGISGSIEPMNFIVDVQSDDTSKQLLYYDRDTQNYNDTSYPLKVRLSVDVFIEGDIDATHGVINGSGLLESGFNNNIGAGTVLLYEEGGDDFQLDSAFAGSEFAETESELFSTNPYAFLGTYYYSDELREFLGIGQNNFSQLSIGDFHYRYEVVQWGDELIQATTDSILNSFYFKPYDSVEFPDTNDYDFRKLSNSQIKNSIPIQYSTTHTYNNPGVKPIKIIVYRYSIDGTYVVQTSLVTKNIVINSGELKSQDFKVFGGTDFKFLPIFDNQVVIGGFNEDSLYHSSTTNIVKDDNFDKDEYLERIASLDYLIKFEEDTLGEGLDQLDLGITRVFSEPKDIYDLLGVGGFNKPKVIKDGIDSIKLPVNSSATNIFIDDDKCLIDLNPQEVDRQVILNKIGGKEKGVLIGDYELRQPTGGKITKAGIMQVAKLDSSKEKQAF